VSTTGPLYDVPPVGVPFRLSGARGVTVTLDEYAPTHLDAWYATAVVGGRTVRAVVVRHAGDVARRRGLRIGFARAVVPEPPSGDAMLAVVVTAAGATFRWLPPGDPGAAARALSAPP
jgi:hypothetical protein